MLAEPTALLKLLIDQQVLRFGEFTLKSGRSSPYFFNLGALHNAAATQQLEYAIATESCRQRWQQERIERRDASRFRGNGRGIVHVHRHVR